MSTLTRRTVLQSTVAAALVTAMPKSVDAKTVPFRPWQAEIDAVFKFFADHNFTAAEQEQVLYFHPASRYIRSDSGRPAGPTLRTVLEQVISASPFKQERLDLILSINHNLFAQHGADLEARRTHVNHRWSDEPAISIRELMTIGTRSDLALALRCSTARV